MKILSILFILMISGSVLACGGDKTSDSSSSSTAEETNVSEG